MSISQLVITTASLHDTLPLTQLGINTFSETFKADNNPADMAKYIAEEMNVDKIRAELLDPGNTFFLARKNGELIGYAKVRSTKIPPELAGNTPLEIERVYVLKQHIGTKAGATLMQHCIDFAISKGYDMIWLGVWEFNHRAVNFYKRWGFDAFGSHVFRLGDDDQTDILMKKGL